MSTVAPDPTMVARHRTEGFRVDLLTAELAEDGALADVLAPGLTVSNNINRDVKRTLDGLVLPRAEATELRRFAHRVRPMFLTGGAAYPLGVFLVADASQTLHSWGTTAELTLVDQGLILTQALDRSVGFNSGYPVAAALADVVAMVGLPAVAIDGSDVRIGQPVAWAGGKETWVRVLNDLAALAGFSSGYFDNAGTFRLRRAVDLDAGTTAAFDYDTPPRVYADSIVESEATLDAANRFVVVSTSAEQLPVVGTWDVPYAAPHSYANRGYRVIDATEVQGLASPAQAAEAARVRGQQAADTFAWASFAAAADPRHDTFDVVRWGGQLWREQGWSLELTAGGEHRHELRRTYRVT